MVDREVEVDGHAQYRMMTIFILQLSKQHKQIIMTSLLCRASSCDMP